MKSLGSNQGQGKLSQARGSYPKSTTLKFNNQLEKTKKGKRGRDEPLPIFEQSKGLKTNSTSLRSHLGARSRRLGRDPVVVGHVGHHPSALVRHGF